MKRNASGRFRARRACGEAWGHLFRISRDRGISSPLKESAWRIAASRVAPSNVTPCKRTEIQNPISDSRRGVKKRRSLRQLVTSQLKNRERERERLSLSR